MARANSIGQGWHFQTIRHSNARRFGRAGGTYHSTLQISPESHIFQNQLLTEVSKEQNLTASQTALLFYLMKTRFRGEGSKMYIEEWAERIKTGHPERYADDKTKKAIEDFDKELKRKYGKIDKYAGKYAIVWNMGVYGSGTRGKGLYKNPEQAKANFEQAKFLQPENNYHLIKIRNKKHYQEMEQGGLIGELAYTPEKDRKFGGKNLTPKQEKNLKTKIKTNTTLPLTHPRRVGKTKGMYYIKAGILHKVDIPKDLAIKAQHKRHPKESSWRGDNKPSTF